MEMIRQELEFLHEHGELKDGRWCCKKTGDPILSTVVGRSIWIPGFSGGPGEVRSVLHIACLACSPHAVPPPYGTPIYENALVASAFQAID